MAAKQNKRTRHVPHRTCVGCRQVLSKREMMRLVRTPDGVQYDPSGKADGRGAYVHNNRDCWRKALDGGLAKALHTTISEENYQSLLEMMNSIESDRDE